mmetsp:Transcript_2156/g.4972  ORF Transcript_2156/g.4972 Transcript_2156/m.4972 type:complete len:239 (-) Transcript_2156:964-1680(-)
MVDMEGVGAEAGDRRWARHREHQHHSRVGNSFRGALRWRHQIQSPHNAGVEQMARMGGVGYPGTGMGPHHNTLVCLRSGKDEVLASHELDHAHILDRRHHLHFLRAVPPSRWHTGNVPLKDSDEIYEGPLLARLRDRGARLALRRHGIVHCGLNGMARQRGHLSNFPHWQGSKARSPHSAAEQVSNGSRSNQQRVHLRADEHCSHVNFADAGLSLHLLLVVLFGDTGQRLLGSGGELL